jgi:L-glutamine-phosphate cytidylyltransferase
MKKTFMKAIILAAGRGSRLKNVAGDVPKCLAPMGTTTLLKRQIGSLKSAGIRDIVVVTGYRAELVRAACGDAAVCIENTRHSETNSLYSLWLAREYLRDGFVVMNGDVLFDPQLLIELLSSPREDALLISYSDPAAPLGEEEMKVILDQDCVAEITKRMDGRLADGENVGIVKFGASGARLLIEEIDRLIAGGAERDWAPRAFHEFAQKRPLHAVSTRGFAWIEIDYPEDYQRAIDEVLPLVELSEMLETESLAVAVAGE